MWVYQKKLQYPVNIKPVSYTHLLSSNGVIFVTGDSFFRSNRAKIRAIASCNLAMSCGETCVLSSGGISETSFTVRRL